VEASGAGERFHSGDPGELEAAAVRLLGADLAALGARGRAHAEAHHDWGSVFDRIFALYREVAKAHRGPATR